MSHIFLMEVIVTVLFLMGVYGYYKLVGDPEVVPSTEKGRSTSKS